MAEATTQTRAAPVARKTAAAVAAGTAAHPAADIPPLMYGALAPEEFNLYRWHGVAVPGSQPEDYEVNAALWSVVAGKLHPWDRVGLVAQDATWYAEYLVIEASQGDARVVMLMAKELPVRTLSGPQKLPAGYTIRRGNPDEEPWVVVRDSDQFVMSVGQRLRSYEAARTWLLSLAIFRDDTKAEYFT